MFYIENEEEYTRAVVLLERLFETYKEPTHNMKRLKEAIVEWEEKQEVTLLDNEPTLTGSEGKEEPR